MNETQVTLTGWLGNNVSTRMAGDSLVASFRLAATPRRFNRRTGEWFDAETQWYTVNAWRSLGEHCAASLKQGDPVVVHGKLSAQRWNNPAGMEMTSFEIEAAVVGPDLNRGTSTFARAVRSGGAAAPAPSEETSHEPRTVHDDEQGATEAAA